MVPSGVFQAECKAGKAVKGVLPNHNEINPCLAHTHTFVLTSVIFVFNKSSTDTFYSNCEHWASRNAHLDFFDIFLSFL